MKHYRYMVISMDNKYPYKSYQTLSGAKGYIRKLNKEDKKKVKVIPIGSECEKYIPNTEWIVK